MAGDGSSIAGSDDSGNGSIVNPADFDFGGVIDPAAAARLADAGPSDSGTGTVGSGDAPKRRRGRPPGSGAGGTRTASAGTSKKAVDIAGIEALLMSLHMMAAVALKSPEIALSKDESEMLARAAKNVADHYPVVLDPKIAAWGNLAMVCGAIYGPRIFVTLNKKKTEEKQTASNVIQMPGYGSLPPLDIGQ